MAFVPVGDLILLNCGDRGDRSHALATGETVEGNNEVPCLRSVGEVHLHFLPLGLDVDDATLKPHPRQEFTELRLKLVLAPTEEGRRSLATREDGLLVDRLRHLSDLGDVGASVLDGFGEDPALIVVHHCSILLGRVFIQRETPLVAEGGRTEDAIFRGDQGKSGEPLPTTHGTNQGTLPVNIAPLAKHHAPLAKHHGGLFYLSPRGWGNFISDLFDFDLRRSERHLEVVDHILGLGIHGQMFHRPSLYVIIDIGVVFGDDEGLLVLRKVDP